MTAVRRGPQFLILLKAKEPSNHNGFKTVPRYFEDTMPTTLTLKNIPDGVYARLRAQAKLHRRSLNSEAIVCLETMLSASGGASAERLARVRELRASLGGATFAASDIDALKRQGRP